MLQHQDLVLEHTGGNTGNTDGVALSGLLEVRRTRGAVALGGAE